MGCINFISKGYLRFNGKCGNVRRHSEMVCTKKLCLPSTFKKRSGVKISEFDERFGTLFIINEDITY